MSIVLPAVTKDIPTIWWGNAIATAGCYAYAYYIGPTAGEGESILDEGEGGTKSSALPSWVVKAIKALDYGSGQERGELK